MASLLTSPARGHDRAVDGDGEGAGDPEWLAGGEGHLEHVAVRRGCGDGGDDQDDNIERLADVLT